MKLLSPYKRRFHNYVWGYFWENFQLPQITIKKISPNYTIFEPKITEDICLPPYLGDSDFQDYSILISLVKDLMPSQLLELGTAHGNTVANICVESNARIYTVNALPEQMEGNIVTYTLTINEIGRVYREHGFQDRVVQIFENTKKLDILEYLPPGSIDMAFIDACHDSDFVVNDFFKILPSLSDKAVVLFHDTHPSIEHWYLDSYIGCMYLRKLGFNIIHIEGSSMGYWSAKNPKFQMSIKTQLQNWIHTRIGFLVYGKHENFIHVLRWLASGFLRGKFFKALDNDLSHQ